MPTPESGACSSPFPGSQPPDTRLYLRRPNRDFDGQIAVSAKHIVGFNKYLLNHLYQLKD